MKAGKNIARWHFVMALMALLNPCGAGAWELGDMKVNSHLGQPLNASISLPTDQVRELNQIQIRLGSKADFEKAGIRRDAVLNRMKFSLVKGNNGKPFLSVTTQKPVNDPILDFIVQVNWPRGRLKREYTVFLDPTVMGREAGQRAKAPGPAAPGLEATGSSAVSQHAMASESPLQSAIATRSIKPRLTRNGYGPTMRPDTLWGIAKVLRPDRSVSIQQMMLALVKKNPEAFYDNNVNELKAGYVLRTPEEALINEMSEVDAVKEVDAEYDRWIHYRKGDSGPVANMRKSSPDAPGKKDGPAAVSTIADAGHGR